MAEIRGAQCRKDGKPRAGRGQGWGAMEKRAKVCGGVPPLPASSSGELCQDKSGWKRQPGISDPEFSPTVWTVWDLDTKWGIENGSRVPKDA